MTPRQLQRFLDNAGLSQRGAAREIGIHERTMRAYIAGDLPVPRTVEFALRWVASQQGSETLRYTGGQAQINSGANRRRRVK
jgi:DNA transposition AAA+ family ATPase